MQLKKNLGNSKDTLGDRMKRHEAVTKALLPIRSYVLIRVDGCHFHTYTKQLNKPYDIPLVEAMREATMRTAEAIQGCKLAYVQSDEASFLLTDFDDLNTSAWYGNQLQKIVSVTASTFTGYFNSKRQQQLPLNTTIATFDARAFTVPDRVEVMNYFLWRIRDAERNSLQGIAQSLYSHKQLEGKKAADLQELIFRKGINWNTVCGMQKRGTIFVREDAEKALVSREAWKALPAPRDKEDLLMYIPTKD